MLYKHFITQTGKKSKTALKNFMGPGCRGAKGQGPSKTNTPPPPKKKILKQYLQYIYIYKKVFCKLSKSFTIKEEHWKILSLRPIKYFTKKMYHGKKKVFQFFELVLLIRTKILGNLEGHCREKNNFF